MRSVTWIGITVASVERNGQKIRRTFVGFPDILICGVAYHVTLLQDVSFLLKTSRRIFTCICASQMFSFSQVYSTEQGENCLNKTVLHLASVMKYEIPWKSHIPIVGRKRRTKVVSAKKIRPSTSEFFMCRFLRVRFTQRKTQNSVICVTELAQVWWQSIRQCPKEHDKKLSMV